MSLASRLAIVMVALVGVTAVSIGVLAYRDLQSSVVPAAVARLESDTVDSARNLEAFIRESQASLLGLTPGFINALALAAVPGADQNLFRDRFEPFIRQLFANHPEFQRVRSFRTDGRETARAERGDSEDTIEWTPATQIPDQSIHQGFAGAMRQSPGTVFTVPVVPGANVIARDSMDLPEAPNAPAAVRPTMAMSTPVFLNATTPVGVLMIDIDLGVAFALRAKRQASLLTAQDGKYVAAAGDAFGLLADHPDGGRLQDDLPEAARMLGTTEPASYWLDSRVTWPLVGAVAVTVPVAVSADTRLFLTRIATAADLVHGAIPIGPSVLLGGTIAAVLAALLGVIFARGMTGQLGRIASAVSARRAADIVDLPTRSGGEIGVLARAVERYAVRDRIISESVGEAIVAIDDAGIIESINAVGEAMFGYAPGDLDGKPAAVLWAQPPMAEGGTLLQEAIGRRKGGVRFPVEVLLSSARFGTRRVTIAAVRDVSERHVAKQKLGHAEDRFVRVFEASPAAIAIVRSGDHRIVEVNRAWVAAFDVPREEAIGKTLGELDILADAQQEKHLWAEFNAHSGASSEVHFRRQRDGAEVVHAVFLQPIDREGVPCALVYGIDITDQKAKDGQLIQAQKMEAVGQLTGGIAHDFNNLLTVIMGNAELLLGAVSDETQRKLATALMRATNQGADLTHRLLAFSRRQTLMPTVSDANQLVSGMTALLNRTLGEKIQVRTKLDKTIGPIFVDPSQLESALLNLAINARDAMPKGGVLTLETEGIDVSTEYGALHDALQPGPYARVSVSDTGSGMPPAVLAKAFEPFFTTKGVGKGTGLGLSMVYGFAKQSHGHVNIYSEVGHGTTVNLYIPLADRTAQAQQARAAEDGPKIAAKVLLVEDQPEVRELSTAQLTALGCEVTAAADADAAVEIAKTMDRIDLLFTDMVLPSERNGRQLADTLLAARPGLRVLFTSGYSLEAVEAQGQIAPGAVLLRKPYRRSDLAEKVREVLAAPVYVPSNRD